MTTWGNITFFRGYDLPVVKTRIFANSLKKHGANCDKFTNRQSYQE